MRSSVFFILRLDPHKYAVAVWRRVEEAEPVYEIVHENVRDIRVTKTLAREVAKRKPDGAK